MNLCLECRMPTKRSFYKYCSNKCQWRYQYTKYIQEWKRGINTGGRGIHAKNISKHLKRFLIEKNGDRCSICSWNEKHPSTHKIPLEVDHIDGNADNNCENNLRLICPNCHSLTPHFKNLNRGKGRKWRLEYIKSRKI